MIKKKRGFSLVELLVVIGILTGALAGLLGVASFSLVAASLGRQTAFAEHLSQELVDQARNWRDTTIWNTDGLGTAALGSTYHFEITGSPPRWTLIAGTETVSGFTRKIVFDEVRRDGSSNIVPTGGTVDPHTRRVTATVSWVERQRTHELSLITYLTNWRQ